MFSLAAKTVRVPAAVIFCSKAKLLPYCKVRFFRFQRKSDSVRVREQCYFFACGEKVRLFAVANSEIRLSASEILSSDKCFA